MLSPQALGGVAAERRSDLLQQNPLAELLVTLLYIHALTLASTLSSGRVDGREIGVEVSNG